jgi:hypothetical protein
VAILVLDLDLTTFVTALDKDAVRPEHDLSEPLNVTASNGQFTSQVHVINRKELSALIKTAYKEHDGVMFLTSGLWDASLRKKLADYLDLTEETKIKLSQCYFHSSLTDATYWDQPTENIRYMVKNYRLKGIMDMHPELKEKGMVLVDDSPIHLDACASIPYVRTVLATTDTEGGKAFYSQAEKALHSLKLLENQSAAMGSHVYNKFFSHNNSRRVDHMGQNQLASVNINLRIVPNGQKRNHDTAFKENTHSENPNKYRRLFAHKGKENLPENDLEQCKTAISYL